jgi:hypothetical protein
MTDGFAASAGEVFAPLTYMSVKCRPIGAIRQRIFSLAVLTRISHNEESSWMRPKTAAKMFALRTSPVGESMMGMVGPLSSIFIFG